MIENLLYLPHSEAGLQRINNDSPTDRKINRVAFALFALAIACVGACTGGAAWFFSASLITAAVIGAGTVVVTTVAIRLAIQTKQHSFSEPRPPHAPEEPVSLGSTGDDGSPVLLLHPVLEYFLNRFKQRDCPPSGILTGNMDRFSIDNSLSLKGGYIVCAEAIKFTVAEFIHCKGPGSGLIAGKCVELGGPDITLVGDEDDPIQLVALENLSIKAVDLKIQNVVFYLFNDANFSMNASVFSRVENVRVTRLRIENRTLVAEEVAYWKDKDALTAFMNHHPT